MTFLLVILVASSLCSVALCGLWIKSAVQLRDLQRTAAAAQNYRNFFVSLANDTMEYSKGNQAINPILEAAGFKPKTATGATTNHPSGK